MAYTALRNCASKNTIYDDYAPNGYGLKEMSKSFLHNTCEELRFDQNRKGEEAEGAVVFTGKKSVPYNMEKDTDRLCLENSLDIFLESGTAQDAFNVYFCYIDMFLGSYGESRHIIEMLSEFEVNGSSLLMKHRDHYSHSVYVFALGLSIYESNEKFRLTYKDYYGINTEREAAHHFLKFWGLTSLFHDIGYPFELPFEEVFGYFESDRDVGDDDIFKKSKTARSNRPFMAYHDVEKYITLSEEISKQLIEIYGLEKDTSYFSTTNDLFSYDLYKKLGEEYRFTKDSICKILGVKPTRPDLFNYYMDHAFWSATALFRELKETIGLYSKDNSNGMGATHIDAITAILLHNSLYKFSIAYVNEPDVNKRFRMEYHPLAYMLMLCDELQCWDRTSYGRNSRTQFHPMNCHFSFRGKTIEAEYVFDEDGQNKIDLYNNKELKKLKSYSNFVEGSFLSDIRDIVAIGTEEGLDLSVSVTTEKRDFARKHTFLSESNFIHLYEFAVVLNARYLFSDISKDEKGNELLSYKGIMEIADASEKNEKLKKFIQYIGGEEGRLIAARAFEDLPLEYKLYNVNQAKGFAECLDSLGAFYTDRPVDYEFYKKIDKEDLYIIGPVEHYRWLKDHERMGWTYVDDKEYGANYSKDREIKRFHKDMVPDNLLKDKSVIDRDAATDNYFRLNMEERAKDTDPMDVLMLLLPQYEGVRFYKYR